MPLLSWLKSIFTGVCLPPHDYIQPAFIFRQLDLQQMQRRLELAAKGEAMGAANLPPTEDDALDAMENHIVTAIEAEAQIATEEFSEHMHAYAARQAALDTGTRTARIKTASEETEAHFFTLVRQGRDELFRLKEELIETEEQYRRFRADNGLQQRPPRYPTSRVLHWALIIAFVLIETPVNGSFLALGNMAGLIGGLVQALVIAVVNVLMGTTTGAIAFRYLAHKYTFRRLLAGLNIVVWIVAACAFNLAVAHYRAALSGPYPEQAGELALQHLRVAPFEIGDLAGWLLCMLGITFNVAAAFDRWKMDDPYPGYGELARRREALESEYICQKQEVENYLAEIKDNALTAVAALSSEIEALKEEHRAIVLSRTNLIERFRGHMQYLEQCGNELLTVYRRANSSRRSTPPPSHFHCKWRLPQIAYSLQSGKVPKIEADTLVENVREVRTTIIEAFRKSMDEFHTIEALGRGGAN